MTVAVATRSHWRSNGRGGGDSVDSALGLDEEFNDESYGNWATTVIRMVFLISWYVDMQDVVARGRIAARAAAGCSKGCEHWLHELETQDLRAAKRSSRKYFVSLA